MMKADVVITVRFLTQEEGGRNTPIVSDSYGCPLMLGDEGFDCRFVLDGKTCFELGKEYAIPIKFLNRDKAFESLKANSEISLWEGKTIATGRIVDVCDRGFDS
ncbi:hypothetical protein [Thiosocius teredinicola]|uniref:hypothetical protein n=1 Tax=Thiosocius teredinicola TaxID=1973002 RepID=UPI000F7A99C0